jgi:hypothetical protein
MALAADFSVILIQMRDSSAVKLETRINGNLAPRAGIAISTQDFPVALNIELIIRATP